MKKSWKIIFVIPMTAISVFCIGQETKGQPNDLDKLYTPEKSSILNGEAPSSKERSNRPVSPIKNSIKFNPTLLPHSIAAFFYERKLSDVVTVQSGLGISYNKDFVMSVFSYMDFLEKDSELPYENILNTQSDYIAGPYLFFPLSFRFYSAFDYPEVFHSGYFDFGMHYTSFGIKIAPLSSPDTIIGSLNVMLHSYLYYIGFGYEFFTKGTLKTTHDFYFGFGIRTISYERFSENDIFSSTNNYASTYTRAGGRSSALTPSVLVGYALGIGF